MSTRLATRDIGQAGIAAIALLAGALLLLPDDAEASQCSPSERVDHRDAECLNASWKNRGTFKKSTFRVQNRCATYGTVVAKVDLVAASDMTLHLDHGRRGRGHAWRQIRSISCCSDMGICNRSDAVTDEGCQARIMRVSMAPLSCRSITATATSPGENYKCTIEAECYRDPSPFIPVAWSSTITVPFVALGEVHNCEGRLQRGPCDDDPVDTTRVTVIDAFGAEFWRPILNFRVFLSRRLRIPVSVDYATSDGTAHAGSDYRATSGTLTFAPGETTKTISVPVLEDSHNEGDELMTLTLSNPHPWRRVRLHDATATGRIANSDPMPKAWIGRFGRTVADQVLDAVDDRMQAKPTPGIQARLAGQQIGSGPAFAAGPRGDPLSGEADASGLGQPTSGRELLPGTSFSLTAETGGEGFVSVWGGGAATRFAGREVDVALDGEVASGLLGADWTRGDWTAGLVVSRSRSDGGYQGAGGGTASATLTGVWPWTRYELGERLSVWAVAGYGDGTLTLEPHAEDGTRAGTIRTDLDLMMAAAGLRGVAVDGGSDDLTLAVKTDGMIVRTASDATSGAGGNMAAAEAEVTRLRLGLEASRPFPLADGSMLTPSLEIGLRHDGGDAETGFGADIGAGLAWQDTERGLGAELHGRGLLAHEAEGLRERGLSASFTWDPVTGDRGPRLSLTQTVGVAAQGGADALFGRTPLARLAANDNGDELQLRRLEARFGYGVAAFGDRFTATPEVAVGLSDAGRDYSVGWRLTSGGKTPDGSALEFAVEARRRESTANDNAPPEHAVGIRVTSRF